MTKPANTRIFRKRLLLFSLACLSIGLSVQLGLHRQLGLVVEGILVLAMLQLLALSRPLVEIFSALGRFYQAVILSLLGFCLIGHFANREYRTFPFAKWAMYSRVLEESPVFYQYSGTTESGQEVAFSPSRTVPSLANSRISIRLSHQIYAIGEKEDDTQKKELMSRHRETLAALGKMHNRDHPRDPIRRIAVFECKLFLEKGRDGYRVRKKQLWEIAVD